MLTQRERYLELTGKYSTVVNLNKAMHNQILEMGKSVSGHGPIHDNMVAGICGHIAEHPRIGEMAFCAALGHSTDRLWTPQEATQWDALFLEEYSRLFGAEEVAMIKEAILNHSKKDNPSKNPVTDTLQDGDKCSRFGPMNWIECGQHHHRLPVCSLETVGAPDPASTFKEPTSCWDTFYDVDKWMEMLHLPRAKEWVAFQIECMSFFRPMFVQQLRMAGIVD